MMERKLKVPLSTEKDIRLMEKENKIVFIVDKATKEEIKKEVEERFKVKVVKVNTMYDTNGKKKAYIKLSEETPAIDIATELGLL